MDGPVQIFTAIALISLPTVMFGGFSLLRLLGAGRLNEFRATYQKISVEFGGGYWTPEGSDRQDRVHVADRPDSSSDTESARA